jgi:hypothetical protein
MEPVGYTHLKPVLTDAGISVSAPSHGIGRELSYTKPPLRTVLVHFGELNAIDYVLSIVDVVLQAEAEWLLIPRYDDALHLGVMEGENIFGAILFRAPEGKVLTDYLCTRPMEIGRITSDL